MSINYTIVGAVLLTFVVAHLVRVAHAVVQRLLVGTTEGPGNENRAAMQARARQLIRALTLLAYGVAALASVSLAIESFGLGEPRWEPRMIGRWLVTHGVNLVVILAGAFTVIRAANLAIAHLQLRLGRNHTQNDLEWQRRAATLSGILTSVVTATVAFVAILMILRELSVDVLPILTGAGIAGLAIGFGAQNLVRDVISGSS